MGDITATVGIATQPPRRISPQRSRPGGSPFNPLRYTWDVTIGILAPDCVSRKKIILINKLFLPTFTFVQGDWIEVSNRQL